MTSMASIISVNENTFLKFVETDAPFYSKLELYHEDSVVSDCSFKPEESKLIKSSVSPVFEKPAGTSKSPAGTKTGDKYASGGPGRPGPP